MRCDTARFFPRPFMESGACPHGWRARLMELPQREICRPRKSRHRSCRPPHCGGTV